MESYGDSKPSKYIYLDANSLYGWAMGQYIPYSGFKWLNQNIIGTFDVNAISEYNLHGYILEIDLEYPDELHESHNGYPLVPENLKLVVVCFQNILLILQINMA